MSEKAASEHRAHEEVVLGREVGPGRRRGLAGPLAGVSARGLYQDVREAAVSDGLSELVPPDEGGEVLTDADLLTVVEGGGRVGQRLDESGDVGRRGGRFRVQGRQTEAPADGDSLRVHDRLDGVAVGGRQRAANLDGRPGPPPVQLDAGAGRHQGVRQHGPQPVQLLRCLLKPCREPDSGDRADALRHATADGAHESIRRQDGRSVQRGTEGACRLVDLPLRGVARPHLDDQVGREEAGPAPEVALFGTVGVVVVSTLGRVGGLTASRASQRHAVWIEAWHRGEGSGRLAPSRPCPQKMERGVDVLGPARQTRYEQHPGPGVRPGIGVTSQQSLDYGLGAGDADS